MRSVASRIHLWKYEQSNYPYDAALRLKSIITCIGSYSSELGLLEIRQEKVSNCTIKKRK
jgi:hypothetical protein